jgi:peptidoglycan/LPS O-acetylase OafA/YrhL
MAIGAVQIRYNSLQAIRAVAACAVLFHNANYLEHELTGRNNHLLLGAGLGEVGVDLFFVLSGFLMVRTTRSTRSGLDAMRRFLVARLVRIYPAYWVVAAIWAVLLALWPELGLGRVMADFWSSILLLPNANQPQLAPGWSLVFELYFYLIFGLMLLAPKTLRAWGLAVWAGLLLLTAALHFRGEGVLSHFLTNSLSLEFLMGAAAGYVIDKPIARPALLLAAGCLVLPLGEFLRFHLAAGSANVEMVRVLQVGVPAVAIVLGMVGLESQGRITTPRWLTSLGERSYGVYLTHVPVASLMVLTVGMAGFNRGVLADAFYVASTLVLSLLLAEALHQAVERPTMALSHALRTRGAAVLRPAP